MLRSVLSIFLIPIIVLAIESVNPNTICDRFIHVSEQKQCEQKIKKIKLDSYLAGTCQKIFDDKLFWECVSLNQTAGLDPKKLERCSLEELSDQQRVSCVKQTIASNKNLSPEFQRLPAGKQK